MTIKQFLGVFLFLFLSIFPLLSFAANCNSASPKITITTITPRQPNPTPQFFKDEILNKNRITQTTDIYGGSIVRVTVEDPTGNSCYFNRLGNISGCKMTKTERKAGQVVSTSTSYFLKPSSKQFIFTPKDLTSNLVLDFSCGTASGKYSVGSTICERPFDQIVGDLEAQKPTIITENSFSDWAKDDKFDSCGFGLFGLLKCDNKYSYPNPPYTTPLKSANSGDRQDWIRKLNINQELLQNYPSSSCVSGYGSWGTTNLSTQSLLQVAVKSKMPRLVYLYFPKKNSQNGYNYLQDTFHAVIAISYETIPYNIGYKMVNAFVIEVIDPNWREPREIICFQTDQFLNEQQIKEWNGALVCRYYHNEQSPGNFSSDSDDYDEAHIKVFSPLSLKCPLDDIDSSLCKRYSDLSGWLKNNFPFNLLNEHSVNKGFCGSWASFVLNVTYFGEFGYECPRPGSGSASTLKSLQLANIQESIKQIIEQIKNLKIKTE